MTEDKDKQRADILERLSRIKRDVRVMRLPHHMQHGARMTNLSKDVKRLEKLVHEKLQAKTGVNERER
jgi:hypothetical protein